MLYNQDWNKPSLADFIGWLETKDPSGKYNFCDCAGDCLMGQYMKAKGVAWKDDGMKVYNEYVQTVLGGEISVLSSFHTTPAADLFIILFSQTYGDALDRARKLRDNPMAFA